MSPNIASYGKTLLGTFEKVILPFHNLALLLTFISTLSIHGLILGFIEPVYPVLISLLITFPFTVGLTIIFLVLYNYKWNEINGSRVIVGLSLFTLLFLLLSSISSALRLSEYARKMEEKQHKKETIVSIEKFKPGNIEKILLEPYEKAQKETDHWYYHIPVVSYFVASIVNFYELYQPARFFSGIAIALFFAYYIQKLIIKRMQVRKASIITNTG